MEDLNRSDGNVRLYFALVVFFAVLCTLSVALRFYAVHVRKGQLMIDDWMVLTALGFYYCQLGVHLWPLINGGYYIHRNELTPKQLGVIFKQLTVVQYQYPVVLTLTRTSVCILLLRIFILKRIKQALYVAITLNVCWGLFVILDASLVCRPFAYNWDTTIQGGRCGNKEAGYMANAIWGIMNDVIIWALPHFVVWKLNTSRARKLALTVVFMLGLVDIIVSIVRLTVLVNLNINGDISFTLPPVQILSFVESGVAIIVASLMVCRPVFERHLPFGFVSSNSDAGSLSLPLQEERSTNRRDLKNPHMSSVKSQPFGAHGKTRVTHTSRTITPISTQLSSNDILVTQDISVARNISDDDLAHSMRDGD